MSDFEKVEKSDLQKAIDNLNPEEKFLYDIEDVKFKLIQNLAKYRQSKGLTQKDISTITGMSQQAVSRIEKYGNEPSLANLLKYMKALDLDINDMFKNYTLMSYEEMEKLKEDKLREYSKSIKNKK